MAETPRVGWWLREALAAEDEPGRRPSRTWDPSTSRSSAAATPACGPPSSWASVSPRRGLLLEPDICGGGPSGRNGGFLHGWWEYLPYLLERYGAAEGLRIAHLVDEVVGHRRVVPRHASTPGSGTAATCASAPPRRRTASGDRGPGVRRARRGGPVRRADRGRGPGACASPALRGGALMPSAATVQPARLARGLRRVLVARGVQIHEGARVTRLRPGTASSWKRPRHAVRGAGGAGRERLGGRLARLRDHVLAWGSYIVLTEPIPGRLAELGWTGGEAIADSRFTVHYFRTTPDGRIAFGAGVGAAGFGGRVDRRYDADPRAEESCPRLAAPPLPDPRRRPHRRRLGRTDRHQPGSAAEIGSRHGGRVHFAHGFAGNGVARRSSPVACWLRSSPSRR